MIKDKDKRDKKMYRWIFFFDFCSFKPWIRIHLKCWIRIHNTAFFRFYLSAVASNLSWKGGSCPGFSLHSWTKKVRTVLFRAVILKLGKDQDCSFFQWLSRCKQQIIFVFVCLLITVLTVGPFTSSKITNTVVMVPRTKQLKSRFF
jgi:hypothetical protein